MSSKIYSITAREILDSRGSPTVETTVILENGYRGTASVPSGASRGTHEAVELRDEDKNRYGGYGVLKAVGNVNGVIQNELRGKDAANQKDIDDRMIALDGTPNKSKLGANALLSVSMAAAVACANNARLPLYLYLSGLFSSLHKGTLDRMPTPLFNIINGGKHGAGTNLNFQEFHVIPATNKQFHEAIEMGVEIYYATKAMLKYRNAIHSVGDEGGFAPNLFTNLDALEILTETIRTTPYRLGVDVYLGLDLAASVFYTQKGYLIKDQPHPLTKDEFISYLVDLHKRYRLLLLEDALEEDDWDGWKKLTSLLGAEVLVVGDDLLATNPVRLAQAIQEKACGAILAKPNQIGTLWEYLLVISEAKKHDIKVIASHRSGETNDSFIADLAVAVQAEYVKFGAPARGERVAKYNRLLQIEAELFPKK